MYVIGFVAVSFLVLFLSPFIQGTFDLNTMTFTPPAEKPNSGEEANEELKSLGTLNLNNMPGPEMTLTNSMKDMKERVQAAHQNITRLKKEMASSTLNKAETSSVSMTQLNNDVESVASSSSTVDEALNKLKGRLANMKQTTQTSESSSETDNKIIETLQTKNDLDAKVPALQADLTSLEERLTNVNAGLSDLNLEVATLSEKEKIDSGTIADMQGILTDGQAQMDSFSSKMESNCKVMDEQFLQIQGVNALKQGERAFIKLPVSWAEASSTFTGGDAMNVIDGSDEVYFYSGNHCQATNYEYYPKPWLMLTLEKRSVVGGLGVLVRGDCCYGLTNQVQFDTSVYHPVSYPAYKELCTTTTSALNSGVYTVLRCGYAREALYILITALSMNQVSFCEIEALGYPDIPESTTYGYPALQSSSFSVKTLAHLAVDNNMDTCSRTKEAVIGGDIWWMVDMQVTRLIKRVTLTVNMNVHGAVRSGIDVYLYESFPSFCDDTAATLCGSPLDNGSPQLTAYCTISHYARYIRVIKRDAQPNEFLELCEVTTY